MVIQISLHVSYTKCTTGHCRYYGVVTYCFGRGKPEHGVSSGPRSVVCQIVMRTIRKPIKSIYSAVLHHHQNPIKQNCVRFGVIIS